MADLQQHFDEIAPKRREWKKRNYYYHESIETSFRFLVPENRKVLELGSGTGELLAALKPSYGVGIDISGKMTVRAEADCVQALSHENRPGRNVNFRIVVSSQIAGMKMA